MSHRHTEAYCRAKVEQADKQINHHVDQAVKATYRKQEWEEKMSVSPKTRQQARAELKSGKRWWQIWK